MASFLQVILDSIQYLWPFRIVKQWERGGYYVGGRFWRVVGPGIYPVIPWLCEVKEISVVPAIICSPRLDITIKDGRTLSFSVAATMRVDDYDKAVNSVDSFTETSQELLSAVSADKLASVDADRLAPEKRGRLMYDLAKWINEESQVFGVATEKVRFTSFVLNVRTYRLLQEQTPNQW